MREVLNNLINEDPEKQDKRRRLVYGLGEMLYFGTGKKKGREGQEQPAGQPVRIEFTRSPFVILDVSGEDKKELKGHLSEITATRKRYMKTQRQINSLRRKTDTLLAKLP